MDSMSNRVNRRYIGVAGEMLFVATLYARGYHALIPCIDDGVEGDLIVTARKSKQNSLRMQIRGKALKGNNITAKGEANARFKIPFAACQDDSLMDLFGLCLFDDTQHYLAIFTRDALRHLTENKTATPNKGKGKGNLAFDLRIKSKDNRKTFFIPDGNGPKHNVTSHFLGIGSDELWNHIFPDQFV